MNMQTKSMLFGLAVFHCTSILIMGKVLLTVWTDEIEAKMQKEHGAGLNWALVLVVLFASILLPAFIISSLRGPREK